MYETHTDLCYYYQHPVQYYLICNIYVKVSNLCLSFNIKYHDLQYLVFLVEIYLYVICISILTMTIIRYKISLFSKSIIS